MFIKQIEKLFKNINELEYSVRINTFYNLVGLTRIYLDGREILSEDINETLDYKCSTQEYDIFIKGYKDSVRIINMLVYHNNIDDIYKIILTNELNLRQKEFIANSNNINKVINIIYKYIDNVMFEYFINKKEIIKNDRS